MAHQEHYTPEPSLSVETTERQSSRPWTRSSLGGLALGMSIGVVLAPVYAHPVSSFLVEAHDNAMRTTVAEQTILAYEDSDVAIVPFGIDKDDAELMAQQMNYSFDMYGQDTLNVDFTVVMPSKEALASYNDVHDEGCVEGAGISHYPSRIAEQHMAEVKDYDKVVGLNALPSCNTYLNGVALTSRENRYAEVFNAASQWDSLEQNRHSQRLTQELDGRESTVGYLSSPVATGVHETLHLYGLGHKGHIQRMPGDEQEMPLDLSTWAIAGAREPFDVRTFVERGMYTEYGDVGIMGQGIMSFTEEMDVVDRYVLDEPYRVLDSPAETEPANLAESAFVISSLTDTSREIGVYTLAEPLYPNSDGHGSEHEPFTQLVIVPHSAGDNENMPYMASVRLLAKHSNDTADLGNIFLADGTRTYDIDIDDITISIAANQETNTLTVYTSER